MVAAEGTWQSSPNSVTAMAVLSRQLVLSPRHLVGPHLSEGGGAEETAAAAAAAEVFLLLAAGGGGA